MKNYSYYFILLLVFLSCEKNTKDYSFEKCVQSQQLELKVFNIENGWGFDIYRKGKLYVHQTNIPAINKSNHFFSEKNAANVGELMIRKICKNIFPPTISIEELDSLSVIY